MTCLYCESPQRYTEHLRAKDLLYSREEFLIIRCIQCGLLHTHPRITEDKITPYYFAAYGPYQNAGRSLSILSLLRKVIRARFLDGESREIIRLLRQAGAQSILEVGPGSGNLAAILQGNGFRVTTIEMDEHCAAALRAAGVDCKTGTLKSAASGLEGQLYDAVILRHSFEHLDNPLESLRLLGSWLSSNGFLLMTVPNASSGEAMWFGEYWRGLDLPRHVAHYEPRTLRKVLAKSGFNAATISPDFHSTSFIESLELVWFGKPAPNWFHTLLYYAWRLWKPAHSRMFGSGAMRVIARMGGVRIREE